MEIASAINRRKDYLACAGITPCRSSSGRISLETALSTVRPVTDSSVRKVLEETSRPPPDVMAQTSV
jgi:hypothetical protein